MADVERRKNNLTQVRGFPRGAMQIRHYILN